MAEKDELTDSEKVAIMYRLLCGEQINGHKETGFFEKVDIMWKQFVFFFRIYKFAMILILAIVLGIIALLINSYGGKI